MRETILIALQHFFLSGFFLTVIVAALAMLGASIYDVKYLQRIRTPSSGSGRLPVITVIILAENVERTLKSCLRSIALCGYGAVEVVVVDNVSTDNTVEVARSFQRSHSSLSTKLLIKRKPAERSTLIHQAVLKAKSSELVLVMDGTMQINQQQLINLAQYFQQKPTEQQVQLELTPIIEAEYFSAIRGFIQLSQRQIAKAISLFKIGAFARSARPTAVAFKPSSTKNLKRLTLAPTRNSLSGVISTGQLRAPAHSLVVSFLQIYTAVYLAYTVLISLRFGTASLLTLSAAAALIWLAYLLFSDDITVKRRLLLGLFLPLALPLIFTASLGLPLFFQQQRRGSHD